MKRGFFGHESNLAVGRESILRQASGHAAVALLRLFRITPKPILLSLGTTLLPLYLRVRKAHAQKLREKWNQTPWSRPLNLRDYYRMRLRLFHRNLQLHGRPLQVGEYTVSGLQHWNSALSSQKPVLLVSHHLGPVEFLHRVAAASMDSGRILQLLTAPAFSRILTAFMREGRERFGAKILPPDSAGLALRKILRNREVLAVMLDQTSRAKGGVLSVSPSLIGPFNWEPVEFMLFRGAWVVPVTARLMDTGVVHVAFEAPLIAGRENLPTLRRRLEEFVLRTWQASPEQGNWSYPRLRRIRPTDIP